ncbi:MAG: hypothetical protein K0Q57_340 [Gammaproteobacteria bacterium]|jgi:hypothetical protein|nr:hypothetical protein [Gammaproteobacteria bacterium]
MHANRMVPGGSPNRGNQRPYAGALNPFRLARQALNFEEPGDERLGPPAGLPEAILAQAEPAPARPPLRFVAANLGPHIGRQIPMARPVLPAFNLLGDPLRQAGRPDPIGLNND